MSPMTDAARVAAPALVTLKLPAVPKKEVPVTVKSVAPEVTAAAGPPMMAGPSTRSPAFVPRTVMEPLKTSNLEEGAVVPTPTLPLFMTIASVSAPAIKLKKCIELSSEPLVTSSLMVVMEA